MSDNRSKLKKRNKKQKMYNYIKFKGSLFGRNTSKSASEDDFVVSLLQMVREL